MDHGQQHPLGVDGFATELTTLVLDSAKSGTHKLVLLLALGEVLRGRPDATEVRLDELGDAAVALLWRQVRDFTPADEATPVALAQARENGRLTPGSLGALAQPVAELREEADEHGLASLGAVRRALPQSYADARKLVVEGLWKNPLPRLQGHGTTTPREVLYAWPQPGAKRAGRLALLPGAAALFDRFLPLLRPLVELEFTRQVATINGIPMTNVALEEHLFGAERVRFPTELRRGVEELQGGRCFYGGDGLGRGWEVDHFIPWAVVPNDAVENLVGASRGRNNLKRELLPALDHLERWGESLADRTELGTRLAGAGVDVSVDALRSLGVARYAYGLLRPGMPVWLGVEDGAVVRGEQTTADRRTALAYLDELVEREERRGRRRGAALPPALAAELRATVWDGGER